MGKMWSTLFILLLLLSIASTAFSATSLKWDASAGKVDGYRIYYGTDQGEYSKEKDVGNTTICPLSAFSLQNGATYYFVVTAYNETGESGPSNEVSWTVPADSIPPAPPQDLSGFLNDNGVVVLSWSANSESDLQGYKVYYGTSSRAYVFSRLIGNQTVYTLNQLEAGKIYYFAVTAVDTSGNESGYSEEWNRIISFPDTVSPSIGIHSPTTGSAYTMHSPSISLGGTASDNIGITNVSWRNSTGGSGIANGTTSWSIPGIALLQGTNVITVTAHDASGNKASRSLTVQYLMPLDTLPPNITITYPTGTHYYGCQSPFVDLAGTASDNVGLQEVSWRYFSQDTSTTGIASGTQSWSISHIPLLSGWNYIVVTAKDLAGNRRNAPLWIYRE